MFVPQSTIWFRIEEVLLPCNLSPKYTALMGCSPIGRVERVILASPLLRETDPILVEPSTKITVPVGAERPVLETRAVKVIGCPNLAGFALDHLAVVVGNLSTTCTTVPVLDLKMALPAYDALTVREPAAENGIVSTAFSPASLAVPRSVDQVRNVTRPPSGILE
jgi:hypothetical protein